MCVILWLQPGYTPPFAMIQNAVWNNPHGYGVLLKENKKIQCIRDLPEDENDPDVIYKILKDNEDVERLVHLRWRTEGAVSMDNVQPFSVFKSNKRDIWFAHNGTLNEYAPPKVTQGYQHNVHRPFGDLDTEESKLWSDSRRYCEFTLKPLLEVVHGAKGFADYTDPRVEKMIRKSFITNMSRGVLFSADLPPMLMGDWKDITEGENTFKTSNDTYFARLIRGKVWEAQETERKKKEDEERARKREVATEVPWTDGEEIVQISSNLFSKRYRLSKELSDIMADWKIYEEEGKRALCNLTHIELEDLVKKITEAELHFFMFHLTGIIKEQYERIDELTKNLNALQGVEDEGE